jgi:hypothetical protein
VDLGLNNLTEGGTQLFAGDPVTVSWSGANLTGAPLIGDWTDGVYLSQDDKWDINDILLGTVHHSGGLSQNQIYSGSLTADVPGVLPGSYQILVRARCRRFIARRVPLVANDWSTDRWHADPD